MSGAGGGCTAQLLCWSGAPLLQVPPKITLWVSGGEHSVKRFNETRVGGQMILLWKWLLGQLPGELGKLGTSICPGGSWWEYLTLRGFSGL